MEPLWPIRMDRPDTRNQAAVALSKLGASKGYPARAAVLSDRAKDDREECGKCTLGETVVD